MIAPTHQSSKPSQSLAQAPVPQVDQERKRAMTEAWKAFRGAFPAPLKVAKDQPDDNVIVNHMEPIVTKGASFLFGPTLKIEATDETTDGEDARTAPAVHQAPQATLPKKPKQKKTSKVQDYLDGTWGDDDDKMTLLSELALNGGVCGQAFIKLIPPQKSMKYPRLVVLDPQIVRIVTLPDDCSVHLAYIIEYPSGDEWQKKQVIARIDPHDDVSLVGDSDLADSWTITNYVRRVSATTTTNPWIQAGPTEDWPYPFAPVFTNKNLPNPNEPWGVPDLTEDLINENKVLNFLFSNLARIIKFHGHPKTVATGVRAADISMAVDETLCLPSEQSKVQILAAMENFSGILSVIDAIMSNIDEQSRVPAVALGRLKELPKGNISGVALQLLFQPILEKTVQKQRLYGKMIRDVSRAALVIGGLIEVSDYQDYAIELHWQNLLPIDDLAAAQTAQILQAIGVSNATLMQELGYNADDEATKSAAEGAHKLANAPMQPPTLPPAAQMPQQDAQQQQAVGMGSH